MAKGDKTYDRVKAGLNGAGAGRAVSVTDDGIEARWEQAGMRLSVSV